jgi:DNA polymerase V
MGFPSPASDYIEDTLTVTKLCRVDANSKIVKTDSGYVILDLSLRPQPGDIVLIRYDGITDFGRLQGGRLSPETVKRSRAMGLRFTEW